MILWKLALATTALVLSTSVNAVTLVEDFNDPFPQWESGWLGTNSNIENIYGVGEGRGNNPDGLWIYDGVGSDGSSNVIEINFDEVFGSSLTSFSIDISTVAPSSTLEVYDTNGVVLLSSIVAGYSGTDALETYFISSISGISGFSISTTSLSTLEGSTAIDNVIVTTTVVPVPAAVWLFGSGLIGLIGFARRKKA